MYRLCVRVGRSRCVLCAVYFACVLQFCRGLCWFVGRFCVLVFEVVVY